MDKALLIEEAQNRILILNSTAQRTNNSEIGTDFREAVFVQLALTLALTTPDLIKKLEELQPHDLLLDELAEELVEAQRRFETFIEVYANKSGHDTPDQIKANLESLLSASPVDLILGNDWV